MPTLPALMVPYICPHDRTPLKVEASGDATCQACQRRYASDDGVLRLLSRDDDFYEDAYHNHVAFTPRSEALLRAWPLWLINSGYIWDVRRHVPAKSLVVELGCAGGVRYFGERFHMIGCDLSRSSLRSVVGLYESTVQADATACLPFENESIDAIVSSYFWEHIAPAQKPALLAECARVLRPSGKLVFLYDVTTENPLIRWHRERDPALYHRLFLDTDGHVGYQTLNENRTLFASSGLRVIEHRGLESTPLQQPSVYSKLAEFEGPARTLFRWSELLGRSPQFYVHTAALRVLDAVASPLLPERWARIAITVCEKVS